MSDYQEKSYVGMGHNVCPVCLAKHSEVVLLNTTLGKTLTRDTFLDLELCPEHKKLQEEGYVALVECVAPENGKSNPTITTVNRTGNLAHIRKTAWAKMFDTLVPDSPLVFVEVGVLDKLKGFQDTKTN